MTGELAAGDVLELRLADEDETQPHVEDRRRRRHATDAADYEAARIVYGRDAELEPCAWCGGVFPAAAIDDGICVLCLEAPIPFAVVQP